MKNKILILKDYQNFFYSSTVGRLPTMDIEKIQKELINRGFDVQIRNFSEVRFRDDDFSNLYILYTSQEDPDLKYKDYIEDILLGLKEKGAVLIPEFKYFRAHHNKVFMEILRDVACLDEIKNVESKYFGTLEEFITLKQTLNMPMVIKPSAGAVSKGVGLINKNNCIKKVTEITSTFVFKDFVKSILSKLIKYPVVPNSLNRNKFVVQNFIKDLSGDRKVLIYGKRYYVLDRKNRENDFRASGSGKFSWPETANDKLLDFAEKIYQYFHVPFLSLDIAEKNGEYFLIEFQTIMFGTFTLERSSFYFEKSDSKWEKYFAKSDLENIFCESLVAYIKNNKT